MHIVPHTHDDVGWLKTIDQYFTGDRPDIQRAEVRYIIDSMIDALLEDSSRTFVYVEMKFFSMWWDLQTDFRKEQVKGLVRNKQLEFIGVGWSMHDEACPTYEDMIQNMMFGQKWLNDNIGYVPRIGWQIDPFGHSAANARLMADMGYDALFFARIDYEIKEQKLADKEMEFVWAPF